MNGIFLYRVSNNKFYHNNFIGNTQYQAFIPDSGFPNFWDDGYPSGGNFWSDYAGSDSYSGNYQNETGSDGIGDTAYSIDADNTDRYPLMGPFSFFDAGAWAEKTYYVDAVSNSTVSDFHFNPDEGAVVRFNVTGSDGTTGFSRVAIPKELLWVDDGWVVLVGGEPVVPSVTEDADYAYLYFTYSHSTKTVEIHGTQVIPEFPTWTAMLLVLVAVTVATAIAISIYKRRLLKTVIH